MANEIQEYDAATPGNNTLVGAISIAELMLPGNVNNALGTLVAWKAEAPRIYQPGQARRRQPGLRHRQRRHHGHRCGNRPVCQSHRHHDDYVVWHGKRRHDALGGVHRGADSDA